MKLIALSLSFTVILATAALAQAGAPAPAAETLAATPQGCDPLAAEIARAESARAAAREKAADAWKALVPIAVAVRHLDGKNAERDAGKRLEELQAEFLRRGCTPAADPK